MTPRASESFALEPPQPVLLVSGKHQPFTLHVRRGPVREPVRIRFSGLPPHVTIAETAIQPDTDKADLEAVADDELTSGCSQVLVAAEGGGETQQAVLPLILVEVPRSYEATDAALQLDKSLKPYYPSLTRRLKGARADFVLIRKTHRADPETFYMLSDKVTVGLFKQFLAETGTKPPPKWNAGAGPDLPALGIPLADAYHCARWLGGNLPTSDEWDKAAGRYDQQGRTGPFRGEWKAAAPPHIGVGRGEAGPLPPGEVKDDVSVFGCRNMGGNGWEWTGTLWRGGEGAPRFGDKCLGQSVGVMWRSQSFKSKAPLLFEELRTRDWRVDADEKTPDDVGFRVVLEPD
jgi:hypothetical protein